MKLIDDGEKQWSFGQLLSMLMLILPVISAIEILRGEMAVPPPARFAEEDKEALFDGELTDNTQTVAGKTNRL